MKNISLWLAVVAGDCVLCVATSTTVLYTSGPAPVKSHPSSQTVITTANTVGLLASCGHVKVPSWPGVRVRQGPEEAVVVSIVFITNT